MVLQPENAGGTKSELYSQIMKLVALTVLEEKAQAILLPLPPKHL